MKAGRKKSTDAGVETNNITGDLQKLADGEKSNDLTFKFRNSVELSPKRGELGQSRVRQVRTKAVPTWTKDYDLD